jgi:16S rRNA processing protein RimM
VTATTHDAESGDMITIGLIVRPHGIRGEVVVQSQTDFGSERFVKDSTVWLDGAETRTIVSSREHAGRWLIGLSGVTSVNDAETLRGRLLQIPAADIHALEAGRFFVHDLIGCRVEMTSGAPVGPVIRVDEMGGRSLLVVATTRGEALVPLAETICREVDVAAKRIVIDPPPGLIDLNAT